MISPTVNIIRSDSVGDGHFRSPRDKGTREHAGVDFVCFPGQAVFAPISGVIIRIAKPYPNENYSGVVIENKDITIKLFYLLPSSCLIGKYVNEGDTIGVAQDISRKYGRKMTPHIHLQIERINPELLL